MRRPLLALILVLVGIGAFTGGLAWLLETPPTPRGASRAETIYRGLCATCHGADGHGSWRATLFLIRPGDLTRSVPSETDQYLYEIIRNGGAPIGRPGMPAFGSQLAEDDLRALVAYLRGLGAQR